MHFNDIHRPLLGLLPIYILYQLDFQKPPKAADTQAQVFRCITQGSLGGYLPTFYIKLVLNIVKAAEFFQLCRLCFSGQNRGHRNTLYLGDVVEHTQYCQGYLPTFYIKRILKNCKSR